MKVVLLAGGFGTRLNEYTDVIPKPMVKIGPRPIVWHIMNTYSHFGHKDFCLALGYKADVIKSYFANYTTENADFTIDLSNGSQTVHQRHQLDWRVTLVDTGLHTMTGGRVKRLRDYLGNEPFMLTYGDGLSDVDLDSLLKFHRKHGKLATVTAVRPNARFGELELDDSTVKSFKEKPQMQDGWINGVYFVLEPEIFELIDGDETFFVREPLERAASSGELMAYKHDGFWQCMDTKRDLETLEKLWKSEPPWVR